MILNLSISSIVLTLTMLSLIHGVFLTIIHIINFELGFIMHFVNIFINILPLQIGMEMEMATEYDVDLEAPYEGSNNSAALGYDAFLSSSDNEGSNFPGNLN